MLIDSHSHFELFEERIEEALLEIKDNKILTIANSMDVEGYLKLKELSKKNKYLIPTFGIHPWQVKNLKEDLNDLIKYIEDSPMIGEVGLDFFWEEDKTSYKRQLEVFEFFIKEGKKRDKVLNIHTKGAEKEVCELLEKYNYNKVIIHWYSGEVEELNRLINLGCYFTASVELGYSERIGKILMKIPLDRLLIETDGPTALPWIGGEYAMPTYIEEVNRRLANLRGISYSEMEKVIEGNFNKLISPLSTRNILTNL